MKKKALLVSCDSLGKAGVQAVMMNIVRNLSTEYQFDMVIFTKKVGYYENEFLSYGGKIFKILSYGGKNRFFRLVDIILGDFLRQYKLIKIIKKNGPYELIHCNNGFQAGWCVFAAKLAGVKKRISHIHDSFPKTKYLLIDIKRRILSHYISWFSTDILACSKEAGKSVVSTGSFTVVTNSYDKSLYNPSLYKQHNDIPLTMIQVGSFCEKKNQIFAVNVFNLVVKKIPNARLKFVGFDVNNYKVKILSRIEELGLKNNIDFYPSDCDIPMLLNNSTFFLMPSLYEGFGIVLVEAQAMGLHCFVSSSASHDSNAGGCTYLPLIEERWSEEILRYYKKYGNKKFSYDCSKFNIEKVIMKYREIYSGISIL